MLDEVINSNIRFIENHGVKMDSDDKRAVYRYGLQILYYYLIDLVVIFSLALLFGKLYETVIMTSIFGLLQVFGGGYHAKTPLKCLLTMLVGVAIGNVLITLMATQGTVNVLLTVVLSGIIMMLPSVENKRHPISNKVKRRSKVIVRSIVIVLMGAVILLGISAKYVEVATIAVTMGGYIISWITAKRKQIIKKLKFKGEILW